MEKKFQFYKYISWSETVFWFGNVFPVQHLDSFQTWHPSQFQKSQTLPPSAPFLVYSALLSSYSFLKVSRSWNKIVEPQILSKHKQINLFFCPEHYSWSNFWSNFCGPSISKNFNWKRVFDNDSKFNPMKFTWLVSKMFLKTLFFCKFVKKWSYRAISYETL